MDLPCITATDISTDQIYQLIIIIIKLDKTHVKLKKPLSNCKPPLGHHLEFCGKKYFVP